MCTEKRVLVENKKKMFTNELNTSFVTLSLGWKDSSWSGNTMWLSSKEKIPGAAVSKEGFAGSLLGHGMIDHYWFLLSTP